MLKLKSHPALMVLTTMLAVGGMVLLVLLFVLISGIDLLQQGIHDTQKVETFAGADACAEIALNELNLDVNYSGSSYTIGAVSCTVNVQGGGASKTLQIEAHQNNQYFYNIEIDVDTNADPLSIDNWEPV